MQLQSLKTYFHNNLLGYYPKSEIQSFFQLLCSVSFGFKPVDIVLNSNKTIAAKNYDFFQEAIERLQAYEPVQYIIGETEFYGAVIKVNSAALIPRPETEELVDWIIKDHEDGKLRILDIGTGSGCIPVALAKHFPDSEIIALDVSDEALKLAKNNAQLNKVNVQFIKADILKNNNLIALLGASKFDVIVSNPPYVLKSEKALMKENVINFEPHLALFVEDNDALIFYKRIAELSKELLIPNGRLYFEINEAMGQAMFDIMKIGFIDLQLRQDLFGKDRMIKGIKK